MLLGQHVQMINCIKALKETTAAVNEEPNLSKFLQLISQNHQYGSHSIITFFFFFGVWGREAQGGRQVFVFKILPSEEEIRAHLQVVLENLFFLVSISLILQFRCFRFKPPRRMWLAPVSHAA